MQSDGAIMVILGRLQQVQFICIKADKFKTENVENIYVVIKEVENEEIFNYHNPRTKIVIVIYELFFLQTIFYDSRRFIIFII